VGRGKSHLIAVALFSASAGSCIATAAADDAAPAGGVAFSALTILTTDYMNRGISQTAEQPAVQGYLEATHRLVYLGLWGSNVDFGTEPNRAGNLQRVADLELGLSGGIRPQWKGISFDLGVFYYAYPGKLPTADLDYVELDATASYTVFEGLTLRALVWWSPDESDTAGGLDGLELSASYALKQIWRVRPTVSATFGRQWSLGSDDEDQTYSYWNAGLALAVSKAPALSFDVRYWDTDLPGCAEAVVFQCDARVVGSLTASF
jgi:uncharacterized protein (TIGR02001 family)